MISYTSLDYDFMREHPGVSPIISKDIKKTDVKHIVFLPVL